MSDKKDKGYDASMLRFVGNLIAGQPSWPTSKEYRRNLADAAISTAIYVRKRLRDIQKEEE